MAITILITQKKMKTILLILLGLGLGGAASAQGFGLMAHPLSLLSARYSISGQAPLDSHFTFYARGYYHPNLEINFFGTTYWTLGMGEVLMKGFVKGNSYTTGVYLGGGINYLHIYDQLERIHQNVVSMAMRVGYQHTFENLILLDVQGGANARLGTHENRNQSDVYPAAVLGIGYWISRPVK